MKPRKLFLQLGRVGDILNVLPLAWAHKERTGETPLFMVAREFAHVLEAVSYVEPVIFEGPFEQVVLGAWQARKLTPDVVFCQIYGRGVMASQNCSSFAREAWSQAASADPWGSLPLVIDRRDRAREAALVARVLGEAPDARPLILTALSGHSSPFPFRHQLVDHLERRFSVEPGPGEIFDDSVRIVDISEVRAERFTDLLALYEAADLLIAVDTGHQHLAHACPALPVISLVTREPSRWHGSPWRRNHVARIYYDEFPRILRDPEDPWGRWVRKAFAYRAPVFVHVWADWRPPGPETPAGKRRQNAEGSWELERRVADWIECPFPREAARRTGRDLGDPHELHFIRDSIEHALEVCALRHDDVLVLTNSDTCFAPGLTGKIADHVRRNNACGFAHRYDFEEGQLGLHYVHEAAIRNAKFYPGCDLFFFTVQWWRENGRKFPDFLAGREGWDEVLRQLIKLTGGRGIDHAIYHEKHPSYWESKEGAESAGNVYNRRLREAWFRETGFVPFDYQWMHLVEKD